MAQGECWLQGKRDIEKTWVDFLPKGSCELSQNSQMSADCLLKLVSVRDISAYNDHYIFSFPLCKLEMVLFAGILADYIFISIIHSMEELTLVHRSFL